MPVIGIKPEPLRGAGQNAEKGASVVGPHVNGDIEMLCAKLSEKMPIEAEAFKEGKGRGRPGNSDDPVDGRAEHEQSSGLFPYGYCDFCLRIALSYSHQARKSLNDIADVAKLDDKNIVDCVR